jgi:Glyoxalase/Bleomycin resistance protein/Dioxygenase superfamily
MSFMLSLISHLPKFIREYIMPDMLIPPISNNPSKVQLIRISHIYFEHPDLQAFGKFARDFGLIECARSRDKIYYRGYGRDPYVYVASKSNEERPKFGGAAFVAASQEEFNKASKLPGASIQDLGDAPGGGQMVTIRRPNDTFIHVVYGQEERQIDTKVPPSETHETQGPYNSPFEKPRLGMQVPTYIPQHCADRFLGQFQRYHDGPALVHKLGHYGYVCKEFDTEVEFYTSNFNFITSDILYHPQLSNVDVLIFLHLDLGKAYSDHHILFLQRAPPEVKKTYIHHSSYEVADFDTQLIGHQWLAQKGWKSVWGVGRHILGSQIFDYWQDPSGFKIEHYADGDVVNADTPSRREVAGLLSVWGPELPKNFGEDGTQVLFK